MERNFTYNLLDNFIGYDDGLMTPGERLGASINRLATGLYEDPIGMVGAVARDTVGDLNYLMFQGGAEREPERVFGYAAAPMAPGALRGRVANVVSSGGTKPKIQDALKAKYPDVNISISEGPKGVTLNKIEVPKKLRNSGVGTSVINDFVSMADDLGATVKLTPSGDFGGSPSRLKKFYKKFGFVENKGKNRDFEISEDMYRAPKRAKVD